MNAPSPSCPDDAAARRLARSMAVVSAFCLTGDTMLYIALPLFWQECGLTALWQVGVLLAVNRLVRLPLNPLVRLLYRNRSETVKNQETKEYSRVYDIRFPGE